MPGISVGRIVGTAFGPMLWGTTYVVFTQTLPVDYPLLVSALRTLPAGLIMAFMLRALPSMAILPQMVLVSLANIGLFSALLLVSAARLPGGVTATLVACQPLLVSLLAWPLMRQRPTFAQIALAFVGMAGVGLMVLNGGLAFDPVGVLAGIGAAISMALGIVLTDHWRGLAPPMHMTAWQLLISGVVLLPVALVVEGLPATWDTNNSIGLAWLALFATGLGYWLWVRGLQTVGNRVAVLAFLSPTVALIIGWVFLQETLTPRQLFGVLLVMASIVLSLKASGWAKARQAAVSP